MEHSIALIAKSGFPDAREASQASIAISQVPVVYRSKAEALLLTAGINATITAAAQCPYTPDSASDDADGSPPVLSEQPRTRPADEYSRTVGLGGYRRTRKAGRSMQSD